MKGFPIKTQTRFFETHSDIEHIVFRRRRNLRHSFRLRRKNYVFYVPMCFKKCVRVFIGKPFIKLLNDHLLKVGGLAWLATESRLYVTQEKNCHDCRSVACGGARYIFEPFRQLCCQCSRHRTPLPKTVAPSTFFSGGGTLFAKGGSCGLLTASRSRWPTAWADIRYACAHGRGRRPL